MKKNKVRCDYCHQPAALVMGEVIYPAYYKLHKLFYWHCEPCGAYVGTHKNSRDHKPYGRLAKSRLRYLKAQAHIAFDPLWQNRIPKKGSGIKRERHWCKGQSSASIKTELRNKAYGWLARRMGILYSTCHIGMFDEDQCRLVIKICNEEVRVQASEQREQLG